MNENSAPPHSASQELRKARDQEERRVTILKAAETVFGTKGYHGASINQIAAEAGFAAGTLYLYFKDKPELYGSVILEKMRQLVAGVRAALTSDTSAAKCLRAFIVFQFSFHETNRQFFEIFLNQTQLEVSPLHKPHWAELEELKKELLFSVQNTIAAGQSLGEIALGEPRLYAIAFLGIVLQIVRQSIREGGEGRLPDRADFAANLFLHGASAPQSGITSQA